MGVLGGTFDPVHIAHLLMAHEAWWQLGLDEVRLVPAATPPHRAQAPMLDAATRARLVEAAVADHPALRLWDVEREREGPSFTVDTLRRLAAEEPGAAAWFILGADQLAALPTWREPREVVTLARLAVAPRPGVERAAAEAAAGPLVAGRLDWLDMPPLAISATMLRERLGAGRPVRYLVPPAVEALLGAGGLEHGASEPLASS